MDAADLGSCLRGFQQTVPKYPEAAIMPPHYGIPLPTGQVSIVMLGSRWVTVQIPVPSFIHPNQVLKTLDPVATPVTPALTLHCHHRQAEPSEPLKVLPLFPKQEHSLVFFGDSFFHPKDYPMPQAAVQTVYLGLLGACEAPAWNCGEAGCYSEMFSSPPAISGPSSFSVRVSATTSKTHPFIPPTPPDPK